MPRRFLVLGLTMVLAVVLAIPASAEPPADVDIDAISQVTDGVVVDAPFESNLPGCTNGTFSSSGNGAGSPIYQHTGVTHRRIDYAFDCDEGGFVIRMIATFGPGYGEPATGNWRVTSSWGDLAGLHAQGTVEGYGVTPCDYDLCVNDIYTGRYHFAP